MVDVFSWSLWWLSKERHNVLILNAKKRNFFMLMFQDLLSPKGYNHPGLLRLWNLMFQKEHLFFSSILGLFCFGSNSQF